MIVLSVTLARYEPSLASGLKVVEEVHVDRVVLMHSNVARDFCLLVELSWKAWRNLFRPFRKYCSIVIPFSASSFFISNFIGNMTFKNLLQRYLLFKCSVPPAYVWKDYHPSFHPFGGCCPDITQQCFERDVTHPFIHSIFKIWHELGIEPLTWRTWIDHTKRVELKWI